MKRPVYVLSRTQQCFIALVATSFGRHDYHQASAIQNLKSSNMQFFFKFCIALA